MRVFTLLATMVFAGCAANPQNIEPISRDYRPLLVNDCATLMDREAATQRDLDRYTELQSSNRLNDALEAVFVMLGKDVAWRTRKQDARNERAIARLRGELEAVQTARAIRCAEGAPAPGASASPES